MTRYRILPYKQGSRSAKALADALGGKVLRLQGSTYKPKADDVIINWGNSKATHESCPALLEYGESLSWDKYKNKPSMIQIVSNKLWFFQAMVQADLADDLPPFWTNKEDIPDEAFPVVCRTILSGHSGAGIVIARDAAELVEAQLYTGYVKKKDEYRVHLGKNAEGVVVVSLQRKGRRLECPEPNWEVRNHQNGFVYVREGVSPPSEVTEAAIRCFEQSGLDFGAVDVLWNDKKGKAYVLEINTAPGLEGQTVVDYATFFKSMQLANVS